MDGVTYESIIGRNDPSFERDLIWSSFPSNTIAITGGAGSIGAEVARTILANTSSKIVLFDHDESRLHSVSMFLQLLGQDRVSWRVVDIKDEIALDICLSEFNPKIVIHAAALKHVPVLESQPRDGYFTNVIGTANIINWVKSNPSTSLVFVSTDKAAEPSSILGKTKLLGERMVQGLSEFDKVQGFLRSHSVVRFGNVFLSRGSVIETFIFQIDHGLPLTITDAKMTRFFMGLKTAAELILFVALKEIPGISIFKMGPQINIAELAQKLSVSILGSEKELIYLGAKPGEKISEELFTNHEYGELEDLGPVFNVPLRKALRTEQLPSSHPRSHEEARIEIDRLLLL